VYVDLTVQFVLPGKVTEGQFPGPRQPREVPGDLPEALAQKLAVLPDAVQAQARQA